MAVDVGCGTGIATIQIAGMLPSAKVYGLDISPVPEAVQKMAPANVAWAWVIFWMRIATSQVMRL